MMMRKWHLWAGLAAAAFIAVSGFWLFLSTGWAVALVQDKVNRGLGRELKVAGGAHLEFSPALALRLDRVSLAGASSTEDDFVTASALRVPLSVTGLFGRRLDLSQVTLAGAEVVLVIDDLGRVSWPTASSVESAATHLLLDKAAIRFFDRRSGQAFALSDADMTVDISPSGELTLGGGATINRQHAKLQAYVKNVARISAAGSPAELSLSAPALSANFNGRLATANGLSLAGTVALSGPDLRQALQWAGGAPGGTMGLKAFTLTGGLDATARAFGVDGAEITVDGVSGKGDLTLDFRGEAPKLQAVIKTGTIDLDRYVPAASGSDDDWGTARLGFSALRGMDGAVTLDTSNLTYSGVAFGPSRIAANLVAGRLDATIVSGSSEETSILLDGSGPVDEFAVVFASRNATSLLDPLLGITWLDGVADVNATVSATGNTQQEMISTLKGEARIALSSGWIRGLDMRLGLAAVSREMQKGWPGAGKGETPFTSLAASFTIADGIATVKNLQLESPALTMAGSGEIDLLRRALDLRVNPRLATAASGETAGLPVAIVVKGPWVSPRIYPDLANIVSNPKAAYDALKAMGLPTR